VLAGLFVPGGVVFLIAWCLCLRSLCCLGLHSHVIMLFRIHLVCACVEMFDVEIWCA